MNRPKISKDKNRLLKVCYLTATSAGIQGRLLLLFLMLPLTVLMRQTKMAHIIHQSTLLRYLWNGPNKLERYKLLQSINFKLLSCDSRFFIACHLQKKVFNSVLRTLKIIFYLKDLKFQINLHQHNFKQRVFLCLLWQNMPP